MNTFKSFWIAVLMVILVSPVFAEIKTVTIYVYRVSTEATDQTVLLVNTYLNKGWRIKAVTASGSAATVTVVLESPPPVIIINEADLTGDLFRIRKLTPEEIAREKAKLKEEVK